MKCRTLKCVINELTKRIEKRYNTERMGDVYTKSEIMDMRDGSLWKILTALRGPDFVVNKPGYVNTTERLKELTTCRLRSIIGITWGMNTGHIVPEPLNEEDIIKRNRLLKYAPVHFVRHFENALLEAYELGYDVPEAELDFNKGVEE